MTISSGPFEVQTDYYQYYALAVGGDFDPSSVDMAHDGVLAPGSTGVRIGTGTHGGQVDVTVNIVDGLISYPTEVVASACNLFLPQGIITIDNFAAQPAYTHDFGHPLTCGLLVTVVDRDLAKAHNYEPPPVPRERHFFQLSATPFPVARWRSGAIDAAGAGRQQESFHVEQT